MLYSFREKDLWLAKFGTTSVKANIATLENSNKELIHIVFPHVSEQSVLVPNSNAHAQQYRAHCFILMHGLIYYSSFDKLFAKHLNQSITSVYKQVFNYVKT